MFMQQKDPKTIFKRHFTLSTTSMNKDMPLSTKTNRNFIRIDFFYLNKTKTSKKGIMIMMITITILMQEN